MLSPTGMQIAAAALICGLAVATLIPAPERSEDGLLMSLLGTVFVATVLMGVLALLGVLAGTALLAAMACAVMVPCAWLARAPIDFYAEDDYEDEDDDGGGSPPPVEPFPSGPDGRRPAPAPAAVFSSAPAPPARLLPGFAAVGPRADAAMGPAATAPAATAPLNPRFPLIVDELLTPGPVVAAPAVAPVPAPARAPAVGAPVVAEPAVAAEDEGTRRPARRLRMRRAWRRWRWLQSPDCSTQTPVTPGHDGRRHDAASRTEQLLGDPLL